MNAVDKLRAAANYLDTLPVAYKDDSVSLATGDKHGLRLFVAHNVRVPEFINLAATLDPWCEFQASLIGGTTCLELAGHNGLMPISILMVNADAKGLNGPVPGLDGREDHDRITVSVDVLRDLTTKATA